MRSDPALMPLDFIHSSPSAPIEQSIRNLLVLVTNANGHAVTTPQDGTSVEEILLDIEIDGSRYLLLRIPKPDCNRVRLSPREQEIVRMVAAGHPNKVIADVLNISSWTVCTHLRRIFAKLGVGSRAAMVAQLIEVGAISSERRHRSGPK